MPITRVSPNTIFLGGGDGPGGESARTVVNEYVALGTILPGHLVEYRNDGGILKVGVHDAADDPVSPMFAIEQDELNLGVNEPYAAGDLVKFCIGRNGSTWWLRVAAGQNLAAGALLQSDGTGKFKALATGKAVVRTLEATGGALAADTFMRCEVI